MLALRPKSGCSNPVYLSLPEGFEQVVTYNYKGTTIDEALKKSIICRFQF